MQGSTKYNFLGIHKILNVKILAAQFDPNKEQQILIILTSTKLKIILVLVDVNFL